VRNIKLLPVLIICLIGALAYLGIGYYWQSKRQASLVDQIETGRNINGLLPTPAAGLQEQLAQLQQADDVINPSAISGSVDTTDIISRLLNLADNCCLKANPVVTQSWLKKTTQTGVYSILPVQLTIQGQQTDLVKFIRQVEDTGKFPSLAIESLVLKENSDSLEAAEADNLNWSAQLTVDIMTRIEAEGSQ
jgi:Tfp pilus assembly protein PilO